MQTIHHVDRLITPLRDVAAMETTHPHVEDTETIHHHHVVRTTTTHLPVAPTVTILHHVAPTWTTHHHHVAPTMTTPLPLVADTETTLLPELLTRITHPHEVFTPTIRRPRAVQSIQVRYCVVFINK